MEMKEVYGKVKADFQHSIKCIAEQHNMSPLNVLTTSKNDIFSELMGEIETIADMIHNESKLDKENVWQMWERFQTDVTAFACPNWNSTLKDNSFYSYLNRRLVESGYPTIRPEILELLCDEMQNFKPEKKLQE
jgi:hypothetical protein